MSDIKLFRIEGNSVSELDGQSVAVEKSLQTLIERHLDTFLGVRFLDTEYATGKTHRGRIDTLGIDENGCSVIVEYKRATNENVITQGLFYLDWLLGQTEAFELLVMKKLGKQAADEIEWGGPQLICVAGDFTRYDEHAVQQIHRNIELIRYRRYGDDLVLLDLVNAVTATTTEEDAATASKVTGTDKTMSETLAQLSGELKDRFEAVRAFLEALGDDVQMKTLKTYVAFKRIKNFACVELRTLEKKILIYANLDPATISLLEGFTRNVSGIGHRGTGDLEITIRSGADFENAKRALCKAYEAS